MSIYEGTIGEREYAHGRDEGRLTADALAEDGAQWLMEAEEGDAHANYTSAQGYRTRAYWLGWLRGFREVSR